MELAKEKSDHPMTKEEVASLRSEILDLEKDLLKQEQMDIPAEHLFGKNCYARTIRIPAGTIIIGKIHKYKTINIISQGDISIISQDGIMRVQSPYFHEGTPGAKRILLAHTDAVWTVVHGTDKTDLDEIEEEFIAKTFDEVPSITEEELKLLTGEN